MHEAQSARDCQKSGQFFTTAICNQKISHWEDWDTCLWAKLICPAKPEAQKLGTKKGNHKMITDKQNTQGSAGSSSERSRQHAYIQELKKKGPAAYSLVAA